jgi:hypothetical protein
MQEKQLLLRLNKAEQRVVDLYTKIKDLDATSSGIIQVTYATLQTLISTNGLSPGAMYKITGFNKNMPIGGLENPNGALPEVLYDDGTDSGVTIYMKALTTNTLSSSGYGEFYNPKYGDQTTYDNTDGTGLYGIWDGDNPDPLEVPEYTVDQVVFWGGYAWKNLIGNVGTAENVITLNSDDWEKLPYSNTTYYESVIDEVKVDWNNGIVIGRTNIENQITVEFNADQYWWWMGLYDDIQTNPISVMGWGLYSKITPEQLDNDFYGISNLRIINSNCETVNFKGAGVLNIDMNSSYFNNNYIGKGSSITDIIMSIYSNFRDNILTNSYIYDITLTNGDIWSNTLTSSSILSSTLTSSFIWSNTLTGNASISLNTLTIQSNINGNTLSSFSQISLNTLSNGEIQNNILTDVSLINTNNLIGRYQQPGGFGSLINFSSNIRSNTLTASHIQNNTLETSNIQNNTITSSFIWKNTLTSSTFNFTTSGTLISKTLQKTYARDVDINEDISAATDIYLNVEKNIYTRLDGTKRLSYFNNSDVATIVNVNA